MPESESTDPLLIDLHATIGKIAVRVLAEPDWLLREVSASDRVLIERIFELAVLIEGGRTDVVH